MAKATEMRHFAVVTDDGVSFAASNVKEEDTPENYHQITKAQYDKFTEDPEKVRHYVWQNNKPVYKEPTVDPNAPPPPEPVDARVFTLEQKIEGLFRRIEALEKRVDRNPKTPKEK